MNKIYGQKLGWIVSTHEKSYNLLVAKYFRHRNQCCTCSSAILKTILNIKIVFGRTNRLHNSLLHQVNSKKKKYPLQESAQKNSRCSASCTLSHCTQKEDRNKNCKEKGLYLHGQSKDLWREHSSVKSHYSEGFQLYLSANIKIHGT